MLYWDNTNSNGLGKPKEWNRNADSPRIPAGVLTSSCARLVQGNLALLSDYRHLSVRSKYPFRLKQTHHTGTSEGRFNKRSLNGLLEVSGIMSVVKARLTILSYKEISETSLGTL